MSYQVLARKWRPHTFAQVVGQEHVVRALSNALQSGRLHHAYLFSGTRGVGKTTLGRILAKSLNCEHGPTATPCGQCSACQEIEEGRFVDLIEIDAASRTKVEDTREILDNVQYRPTRGRYKVYLIDEVHMLSRHSFNALLKTLEEPPEHVKFLLATTDPQKLPVTILSRCLQFNLKALTVQQMSQQLQTILDAEQIGYEGAALTLLAKAARGSMRDALSLADQAIAHGEGQLSVSEVTAMLGMVAHQHVEQLVMSLLHRQADELLHAVDEVAQFAPDYDKLMSTLMSVFHQASLAILTQQTVVDDELIQPTIDALVKYWQPEDLQLAYQIMVEARRDLPFAPDGRTALEMALLRVILFEPVTAGGPLSSGATSTSPTITEAASTPASNTAQPAALSTSTAATIPAPEVKEDTSSAPSATDNGAAVEPAVEEPVHANEQAASLETAPPEADERTHRAVAPTSPVAEAPEPSAQAAEPAQAQAQGETLQDILNARSHLRSRLKALTDGAESVKPTASSAPAVTSGATDTEPTQPASQSAASATAEPSPAVAPEPELSTPAASMAPGSDDETTPVATFDNATEHEREATPLPPVDDDYYAALMADAPHADDGDAEEEPDPDFFPEPPVAEEAATHQTDVKTEALAIETAASHAPVEEPPATVPHQAPAAPSPESAVASEERSFWEQTIDNIGLNGLGRQVALDCALVRDGEGYLLQVPQSRQLPNQAQYLDEIITALKTVLGQHIAINIEHVQHVQVETPRAAQQRRDEEALERARQAIAADPNVQQLQERFGAQIAESSIRPV